MKRILYLLLAFSLILASCKKPKPDPDPNPSSQPGKYDNGVWILNEGNFQAGNASISFFDSNKKEVTNHVFENTNNRPIGDVLQYMYKLEDRYYIVVNNSQKIEITDQYLKSTGQIEGFESPRYFLPVSENKAYVTDLYAKGIWIVDLAQNKISGKIPYRESGTEPFQGWTEQMAQVGDKAFVLAVKTGQLLKIDIASDKIVDSVSIGIEPQWLVKDKDDKLWILTNGSLQSKKSNLFEIDPQDLHILNTLEFPSTSSGPSSLVINDEWLYYIDKDIYRVNISSPSLPSAPFITAVNDKNFHATGIFQNMLLASDALDYIKPGKVYYYNIDAPGAEAGNFEAGMIPAGFCPGK